MIDLTVLPQTWTESTLGRVARVLMGQSPPSSSYNQDEDGLPLIGGASDLGKTHPQPTKWTSAPTRVCELGDLIYCIRATIGVMNWADRQYCLGRGVAAIRADENFLDPAYVYFWLTSIQEHVLSLSTGSTFAQIRREDIENLPIPLPTLFEQRRIVEILSLGDEIRRLRVRSQDMIKAFRTSLFDSMFGQPAVEAGGWEIRTIAELGEVSYGLTVNQSRRQSSEQFPYLRVANVFEWEIDLSKVSNIGVRPGDSNRYALQIGDVLVVEGHGDPTQLGRAAAWEGQIDPCLHQNHLLRIRPFRGVATPHYLVGYLNSSVGRDYMLRFGKTSSGLNTINSTVLAEMPIPYPPYDLQEEFEERYAAFRTVTAHAATSFQHFASLQQSLLSNAFTGGLTQEWRDVRRNALQDAAVKRDIDLGLREAEPTLRDFEQGRVTAAEREEFQRILDTTLKPALDQLLEFLQVPIAEAFTGLSRETSLRLLAIAQPAFELPEMRVNLTEGINLALLRYDEEQLRVFADLGAKLPEEVFDSFARPLQWAFQTLTSAAQSVDAWPPSSYPRHQVIRQLGFEQKRIHRACYEQDNYFTVDAVRETLDLPVDTVKRGLDLLVALGLIMQVSLPASPTGDSTDYVPVYRLLRDADEVRLSDQAALNKLEAEAS